MSLAGVALVFVQSLGVYITPELMGGKKGKSIAVPMAVSQNVEIYNSWGVASASALQVVLKAECSRSSWCREPRKIQL